MEAIRPFNKLAILLEDSDIESLKTRMHKLIKSGRYRLNHAFGYSVNENITRYDNTVEGIRFQGILEKR